MTRGRRENEALPLTKELARQREFRAKRAAKQKDLEVENLQLRQENQSLRDEASRLRAVVDLMRSGEDGQRNREMNLALATMEKAMEAMRSAVRNQAGLEAAAYGTMAPSFMNTPPSDYNPNQGSLPPSGWRMRESENQHISANNPGVVFTSRPLQSCRTTESNERGTKSACTPSQIPPKFIADQPNLHELPSAPSTSFVLDETKCCFGVVDCDEVVT